MIAGGPDFASKQGDFCSHTTEMFAANTQAQVMKHSHAGHIAFIHYFWRLFFHLSVRVFTQRLVLLTKKERKSLRTCQDTAKQSGGVEIELTSWRRKE